MSIHHRFPTLEVRNLDPDDPETAHAPRTLLLIAHSGHNPTIWEQTRLVAFTERLKARHGDDCAFLLKSGLGGEYVMAIDPDNDAAIETVKRLLPEYDAGEHFDQLLFAAAVARHADNLWLALAHPDRVELLLKHGLALRLAVRDRVPVQVAEFLLESVVQR